MGSAHIIADSSIWIDHINKKNADLAAELKRGSILLHPMIIAEVALGSIANRAVVLEELRALPQARPAAHDEVMAMIDWLDLFNRGIGYVDVHLLAAARQLPAGRLWTGDKRLAAQAERLEIAFSP